MRAARHFTTAGSVRQAVVRRLPRRAARVGIRPRMLLLDRGFYSVAAVRFLKAAWYPFLMPVVCHGRSPKQRGGDRQLRLPDVEEELHFTVLARPRRGWRVILLGRLPWETLLPWLLHVVEEAFGVADVTRAKNNLEY